MIAAALSRDSVSRRTYIPLAPPPSFLLLSGPRRGGGGAAWLAMIHQASSSLTGNYKTADLMPLAKDLMEEVGSPREGRFSGLKGRVEHRTLHTQGFEGVLGYPDWDDLDVRSAAISSGPGPVLNKLGINIRR
ncbi:unnamed protein product [Caretta caretta]